MNSFRLAVAGIIILIPVTTARADQPVAGEFPSVEAVAAQPLIAQARRLQEALEFTGQPLPADAREALSQLHSGMPDAEVTAAIQKILDAHALVAVEITEDGMVLATGPVQRRLLQQGWRGFLVKVLNRTEIKSSLDAESPAALQLANAAPDDVDKRWLDVSMYNGRPMNPLLSGLLLEYRIIHIYSAVTEPRDAVLRFRLGGRTDAADDETGIIEQWTFDNGMDDWSAEEDCDASVKNGNIHAVIKGYAFTGVPGITRKVAADGELMALQLRMSSDTTGVAQVFWKDAETADWKSDVAARAIIQAGGNLEHVILLPARGPITELRLLPLHTPSTVEIDWIRLSRVIMDNRGATAALALAFETEASIPVTLNVLDENGEPCTAAFTISDRLGRVYPSPAKRLAPDFYFHPQIYRSHGEAIRLPAGEYTVTSRRGPESIPETKELTVSGNAMEFVYRVQRWIDPAQFGWWSGDHHIHAAGCAHYASPTQGVHAFDMARHIMGEDLKVGCNLTWGPCFDYQKQFFTGKVDKTSQYPYLLRYDVEVSGFGSHQSGHLCLLRLKEQIYPGGDSSDHWPTLGLNTLKWAKAQGAVTGPAHSGSGLMSPGKKRVEGTDGPMLFGWKHSTVPLPNHNLPRYTGIGANEYIVDITHEVPGPDGVPVPAIDFISSMDTERVAEWNMWYHTLNCGFRVRVSGETDFPCISGQRVGMGRVYVKQDGRLDYDAWCEGIRQGRSYVSDGTGHLIDFSAEVAGTGEKPGVGEYGSELKLQSPDTLKLSVRAAVRWDDVEEVPVELVVNGYPAAVKNISADGSLHDLEFDVPIDRSSWVAVRAGHSAHTNPIFVLVNGKPIRPSVSSAEWCRQGVDICWDAKKDTYDEDEQEDAIAAYEHARGVYDRILAESRAAE